LEPWQTAPVGFSISNGAWRTNGATDGRHYEFNEGFLSVLKNSYGVQEAKALDFKKSSAADEINAWVKKETFEMIPSIVNPDVLSDLIWVLINTTHFEGSWSTAFDLKAGAASDEANFTMSNGQKVNA